MADTTTTLNPGAGGDKMDETLVLQSDAVTQAKRPRVVIGGDSGYSATTGANDLVQPQSGDPGKSPVSLPTLSTALVSDLQEAGYVDGQLRALSMTATGRLRVATEAPTPAFFDDDGDASAALFASGNPWGDQSPW